MVSNAAYGRHCFAALLVACCAVCGSNGPVLAAPPEEALSLEDANWSAKADEVEKLPAWQWLNTNRYSGTTTTLGGGVVDFVGYFRPEDLNRDLLKQFDEGPLTLAVSVDRVPFKPSGQVRVLRFPVPGHPGLECAALVQVRLEPNRPDAAKEAARVVDSYAHHLPQRPLTPSCNEGPLPPVPDGFSERIDVKHFGPLLNEPQRACADFPPAKVGTVLVTSDTRIEYRLIVVGDWSWFRSGRTDVWYHATPHFDFFRRGFESYFYRSGLKEMVRYDYGNYAPRPQDISVAIRVIEDPQADAFCYVVDIQQGSASQRFVRTIPREGRVLPWNKSDASQRVYDPGKSLIDWGTQIATGMIKESDHKQTEVDVKDLFTISTATHVPAAAMDKERSLQDQPQPQQAALEVIQTQPTPPPQIEVRVETRAEAAARSKAQAEKARARGTASKARKPVPLSMQAWAARIMGAHPIAAKRAGLEGTVRVAVTVGPDGRATKCKVTRTSGYPVLDDAACKGMERYARFAPALDRKGRPIPGKFSTSITYKI